jgi:SAM-dependent methyltransferase
MLEAKQIMEKVFGGVLRGDATKLPFEDNTFDCVVTSEVLEHIQDDVSVISELHRVLKPGGSLGVTVPSWWPEKINWMLSDEYHAPKSVGGHVRIYSATELKAKLRSAGLEVTDSHHAHALHSPYWWLKCAVGPRNNDHSLVKKYREFLEWDIMTQPRSMQVAERALSPLMGKSFVVYSRKPLTVGASV